MTGRAPKTVHLKFPRTFNVTWCHRRVDPMFLTDDPDAATCRLCLRTWEKAGRPQQLVML
jgi:hypothetical protein